MSSKKIIKGVSYGRVSTMEQAFHVDGTRIDDASPQMQKLRCQQAIDQINLRSNQKEHYEIISHLGDDGFSGKNTKRPGFQSLITHIKSGEIKFVIAAELSRLSRNTLDFLEFFNLCAKHSVDVIIIGLNLDTTTPYGKVLITILMALAEFERNVTGERVRLNSKARLISDGKINGSCEILGLDKCLTRKGHYEINRDEVKIIEQIFGIFLLTSSRAETFREVQKLNIKWKRKEDFTKQRFMNLFNYVDDRYRGVWPLHTTDEGITSFVNLPHGPVVDITLLNQVQEKLLETKVKKRQKGKNYTYLLSTLLEHEDGSSFSGQPAKKRQYRYYFNKSNNIRIRCDEIEKEILKRAEEYISNEEALINIVNKTRLKSNRDLIEINVKIAEVERDLKVLMLKEQGIKDKVLVTADLNDSILVKVIEEELTQIRKSTHIFNSQLEALHDSKKHMSAPISTLSLRKSIKALISEMGKLPSATHRGMLEKVFHKIVVKTDGEIELQMFGEILGENKTTRSSSGGLNGGSNKT